MSKAADLREADESELETRLAEAKQELFNLRFQMVTGQQDNDAAIDEDDTVVGDERRRVRHRRDVERPRRHLLRFSPTEEAPLPNGINDARLVAHRGR